MSSNRRTSSGAHFPTQTFLPFSTPCTYNKLPPYSNEIGRILRSLFKFKLFKFDVSILINFAALGGYTERTAIDFSSPPPAPFYRYVYRTVIKFTLNVWQRFCTLGVRVYVVPVHILHRTITFFSFDIAVIVKLTYSRRQYFFVINLMTSKWTRGTTSIDVCMIFITNFDIRYTTRLLIQWTTDEAKCDDYR